MRALLLSLFLLAACSGDDDGPVDAGVPDAAVSPVDGGTCTGSADCGGQVCCGDDIPGGSCVPSFDDCAGLVLCDGPDDCPEVNPICCPQGFCGGCD